MLDHIIKGPPFWHTHNWNLRGALTALALDGAAVLTFGLLTLLWSEARNVPSIVWTAFSAIAMAIAAWVGKAHIASEPRTLVLTAAFLGAYFLGCGFSYLVVSDPHPGLAEVFTQNSILLVYGAIYFMFGAAAGGKQLFVGFAIGYLILAGYTIISRDDFSPDELYKRFGSDGVIIAYQQLGDSLVICALMILARIRQRIGIYAICFATIVLLMIIPSRSALVFGSIVMILWALQVSTVKVRIAIVLVSLIFAMTARFILISNLSDTLEGTRHSQLLTPAEDASQEERFKIMSEGLNQIRQNPIFGNFGFQLTVLNDAGMYVHNVLDVWVQAGLLPFLMFFALWIFLFRQWYLMNQRNKDLGAATLPMLVFPAISWLVSRHVAYVPLYFCLGYFSATLLRCYRSPSDDHAKF